MNYGNLVTRPFHIVARRPYLWLLGLLAGGGAAGNFSGGGSSYRGNTRTGTYVGPDWAAVQSFWNGNWTWIVALVVVAIVVAVVLFALGCIATGGIIHAAVEHDAGHEYGLGRAWRAGSATAWRIAGLRLLTFLLAILPGALVGGLVLAAVAGATASTPMAVTFGLLAGLAFLASLVFWLALAAAYQLAQRFIVLEDAHVTEGLNAGFATVRWHLKEVVLGWLLLVAISIAASVGMAIVALIAGVPAALVGFAGWALAGTVGLIVLGSFAAIFFLGVVIAAAAAVAAYSSVYWSLLFTGIRALPAPAGRGAMAPA